MIETRTEAKKEDSYNFHGSEQIGNFFVLCLVYTVQEWTCGQVFKLRVRVFEKVYKVLLLLFESRILCSHDGNFINFVCCWVLYFLFHRGAVLGGVDVGPT
jgi:hypothetical protein